MRLGSGVGEGYVKGIKSWYRRAYQSAEGLSKQSQAGARNSLFFNDDDLTPRITPVVDLTNVQRSAKDISGMLSASSINPAYIDNSIKSQNGSLQAVILSNKLDKLTDSLSTQQPSGDVYNIGDVTLSVQDMREVNSLNDFVAVIKRAKAFN